MRGAVLSNSLILLVLVAGGVLAGTEPGLYYRLGQEDGFLEWATFWAFVIAAWRYWRNALHDRRTAGGIPWFAAGLGLFCVLVALEEISWGQRLFGYRPPDYFLQQNYQQEFNLHNIASTSLRKFALLLVLAGYGVGSALVALVPAVAGWFRRWRIVPAPAALVPAFVAMTIFYAWYPFEYTGEWVELAMGLGFLFAAVIGAPGSIVKTHTRRVVTATIATVMLAGITVLAQRVARPSDAATTAIATAEVEALAADFAGPKLRSRCGIHKRLYTFMRDYGQTHLLYGAFAKRLRDAGEHERANYLLDPWNSPYWLRHRCDGDRVAVFVYSFGPDRQRDSSEWAIRGDDIGVSLK